MKTCEVAGDRQMSERPLAVVTGGSSGIGAAIARQLARRGYRTVIVARRAALLRRIAEEISADCPCAAVVADLANPEQVEAAIRTIMTEHGTPEVLVNCAGYGAYRTFLDHSDADHERLLQVNYLSARRLIQAFLPAMIERRRGHVINITSVSAKFGPWGHAGYAAAKAALTTLTQTLACEYAEHGVNFSYVKPGIVDTEYFQQAETAALWSVVRRRAISAEAVAAATVRLLDRPRLELCVPRHYRFLDVIRAISPGLVLRLVRNGSRPARAAVQQAPAPQAE